MQFWTEQLEPFPWVEPGEAGQVHHLNGKNSRGLDAHPIIASPGLSTYVVTFTEPIGVEVQGEQMEHYGGKNGCDRTLTLRTSKKSIYSFPSVLGRKV